MPARDGTGPLGLGQMTGRGQGNCVISVGPQTLSRRGRGLGRRRLGLGLGFGFGCLRYFANVRRSGFGSDNAP
jgi:hypothetical protein